MQFNRFTWLDRVGQHLNRRILTKQDGSTETVDVARGDDSITVEGTPFAAETMNSLENRIAAAFEEGNAQFTTVGTNIQDLKDDVEAIYYGANRVNYIENRCLLDDGSIVTASGYCVTPTLYLPESDTRTLLWGCRTHTNVGGSGHDMALIVYDGAGAVLATYKARMTSYVTIPAGAKTVVASFYIPDTAENNIMLTVGSEPAYEFYKTSTDKVDGLVGLGIQAQSAFATASEAYHKVDTVAGNLASVERNVQTNTTNISSIQTELTKTTVTGAVLDTTNFTGTIGVAKYGNIAFVTLVLAGAKAMTSGSSYKVATLPASVKPSGLQFGVMLYNGTFGGRLYVDTNGIVQFTSVQSATFGNGLRATLVYLI